MICTSYYIHCFMFSCRLVALVTCNLTSHSFCDCTLLIVTFWLCNLNFIVVIQTAMTLAFVQYVNVYDVSRVLSHLVEY